MNGVVVPVAADASTALVFYEEACRAVAAAKTASEAKEIADKAEAMRVYAKQAQNRQLEIDAAEIRIRAERRLGEYLCEAKEAGQLAEGRRPKSAETVVGDDRFPRVRLQDVGISKDLSSRAQAVARLPEPVFAAQVERWRGTAEREGGRVTTRLVKGLDQKEMRATRERELAERQRALPERRYGVIYADPEWEHEPWSETGMDRAAANHYPVRPWQEIAARPVASIAAQHCALFMWVTVPHLAQGLAVLAAWGFEYKSHAVWRKRYPGARQGLGKWFRINHEILLLGTRGAPPCPAPGQNWGSVVEAEWTGVHSEKPEVFAKLIEDYYPTVPKIELNARRARPGWDVWGNEAPEPVAGRPPVLPPHDPETGEIIEPAEAGERSEESAARWWPSRRSRSAGPRCSGSPPMAS